MTTIRNKTENALPTKIFWHLTNLPNYNASNKNHVISIYNKEKHISHKFNKTEKKNWVTETYKYT